MRLYGRGVLVGLAVGGLNLRCRLSSGRICMLGERALKVGWLAWGKLWELSFRVLGLWQL